MLKTSSDYVDHLKNIKTQMPGMEDNLVTIQEATEAEKEMMDQIMTMALLLPVGLASETADTGISLLEFLATGDPLAGLGILPILPNQSDEIIDYARDARLLGALDGILPYMDNVSDVARYGYDSADEILESLEFYQRYGSRYIESLQEGRINYDPRIFSIRSNPTDEFIQFVNAINQNPNMPNLSFTDVGFLSYLNSSALKDMSDTDFRKLIDAVNRKTDGNPNPDYEAIFTIIGNNNIPIGNTPSYPAGDFRSQALTLPVLPGINLIDQTNLSNQMGWPNLGSCGVSCLGVGMGYIEDGNITNRAGIESIQGGTGFPTSGVGGISTTAEWDFLRTQQANRVIRGWGPIGSRDSKLAVRGTNRQNDVVYIATMNTNTYRITSTRRVYSPYL